MKSLGALGMDVFNQALRRWRQEGKHITWDDLNRAYRLGQEAEEAERAMRGREK